MSFPAPSLILLSAASFGAMGVFGTLAYEQGATVGTLLTARFVIAAVVWWAVLLASRAGVAALRSLRRRDVVLALGLGAIGYAGQAGGYFTALERTDPALLSLLVYTYPGMVTAAAVFLGRERLDNRRLMALGLTFGGLLLVVAGVQTGAVDGVGIALGTLTAVIYSAYILTSDGVASRLAPSVLATLVCTGAALTMLVASAALGDLHPAAVTAGGWLWLSCIAIISTVAAVALFFAGMRRVGPSNAAILSIVEPLVAGVLAFMVFGDVLGPAQVLGGAFMLAGVVVLNLRIVRVAHATA